MAVEVRTPDDYMGEVIGDLNARRGQIQAMEERSGGRVVRAHVPLSEMFGYVGDLRSRTQGRADYSMQFRLVCRGPAQHRQGDHRQGARRVAENSSHHQNQAERASAWPHRGGETIVTRRHPVARPSSSGPSRTSTSAPSVILTTARRP